MPRVVGVTFRRVGKVYYFDPGEHELHEGDFVIAETARGVEFGEVVIEPRTVPEEELVAPLKNIVRVATGDDLEREAGNRDRERHAFEVCERKIAEHGLPMKLLEAEFAFDGSQVTFSFSADGRVDFRQLVKDVAGALRTKVQLHQIGVRDEAKLIGGYGTCGRPLCCATFLSSFEPISMKMAKDQSLFLNPAKFSGACGKLMCCLRYEHDFYKQAQKRLPALGAIIPVNQGRAKVVDVNVVSGVITVHTEEDTQLHLHVSQIDLSGLCRRHGIGCNMNEPHCQPLRAFQEDLGAEVAESADDDIDDDLDADISDEDAVLVDEEISVVTRWRSPGDRPASADPPPKDEDSQRSGPQAGGGKPRGRGRNDRSEGGPDASNSQNRPSTGRGKRGNGGKRSRGNSQSRRRSDAGPESEKHTNG